MYVACMYGMQKENGKMIFIFACITIFLSNMWCRCDPRSVSSVLPLPDTPFCIITSHHTSTASHRDFSRHRCHTSPSCYPHIPCIPHVMKRNQIYFFMLSARCSNHSCISPFTLCNLFSRIFHPIYYNLMRIEHKISYAKICIFM